MTELAIDRIEAALVAVTGREVRNGTALCPAHNDSSPSLSVAQGHDRVLLHCHAGCSVHDVVAALGLTLADLFDEPLTGDIDSCNAVIAQYVYQDADGNPAHMVQRRTGKKFSQHTPDGNGGWRPGLNGCELFPYHLPELLTASPDTPVHICEGEKDVEAIRRAGGVATCNAGGAGKWKAEYDAYFQDRKNVTIVADKDAAGEQHAQDVYRHLSAIVPSIHIVQGLGAKDAFDHIAAGNTLDEFEDVTDRVLDATSKVVVSLPPLPFGSPQRPVMMADNPALHGVAGDIVREIVPESEADPAALLTDLLVACGNAINSGPHAYADGSKHPARLFAVIVGESAKARKGTSHAVIERVMKRADPMWAADRMLSGLGSGEGLIATIADPKVNEDGNEITGSGSRDRRLYVIEPEFGRVLNINNREGSTLSHIVRAAWDSGNLRVITRKDPLKATNAHVSILGHITLEELKRTITSVDIANGFANRFLFISAARHQLLPTGGNLTDADFDRMGGQLLRPYIENARKIGRVQRTAAAEELWAQMYAEFAEDDPGGALGAVIARADAQVLRLSLVYALLDGSPAIDVEHLEAAKAFWDYARASAEYIFGTASANPVAERLLEALQAAHPDGLDFTQQVAIFGNHVSAAQLDSARTELEQRGFVVTEGASTGGRKRNITRLANKASTQ